MAGFPARFSTYEEYVETLQRTRDAGGFLFEIEENKPIIHFLGIEDQEDRLLTFETAV